MYENSLETATMQRAKTILYLEQKLSSSSWQQYCEYIQKECSPEVSSLSEEMCLGRRDKKRNKEKLIRSVDEIHTIMTDRFGQNVGTKTSDIDKLLAGINKLNDILTSQAQHSSTLNAPGSINLNIILEQRNSLSPILNGVAFKREEFSHEKIIQCDENQNIPGSKQTTSKQNIEQNKKSQNFPSTSSSSSPRLSDDEKEGAGMTNQKIEGQLDVILNLMKETIKNGRVNFTLNGRAVGTRDDRRSVEHLLQANGKNSSVQTMTSFVDRALNIQADQGIMNRACSPVQLHEDEADDTRYSPLDLYTSDEVTEHTPIHSPSFVMGEQSTVNLTERLNARYEGSSFLSTSSADGNTTCDENGYTSSQMSVASISKNSNQRESPNSEEGQTKIKPNQTKRSHRRIQPPKTLFLCAANGGNHGSSSESDVSSHECKMQDREEVPSNRPAFVCEDDFSSSSQGTDMTDQSCDNDSHVSGTGHYASTDIGILSYGTSPEHDSLIPQPGNPRIPQVRWADTASEPGSTPFLNIWEISPTPSDHFSGEIQVESDHDTATGDEGHSGSAGNKGQQSDV